MPDIFEMPKMGTKETRTERDIRWRVSSGKLGYYGKKTWFEWTALTTNTWTARTISCNVWSGSLRYKWREKSYWNKQTNRRTRWLDEVNVKDVFSPSLSHSLSPAAFWLNRRSRKPRQQKCLEKSCIPAPAKNTRVQVLIIFPLLPLLCVSNVAKLIALAKKQIGRSRQHYICFQKATGN
jgi:hypothetical protein